MNQELTPEQEQTLIAARDRAIEHFTCRLNPEPDFGIEPECLESQDLVPAAILAAVSLTLYAHTAAVGQVVALETIAIAREQWDELKKDMEENPL